MASRIMTLIQRGSWKTTVVALIASLGLLATEIWPALQDPEYVMDLQVIGLALAIVGLGYFARDNNRTSEQVGAGRNPTPTQETRP